ncbi:PREDICTED: matrix extracellular phosphoglycoprotein-like [Galeopterus variegatus]|uniref:Matrix extracellular phosphoglycoprotein-like n=1 Tax=Galeopterus variegatus TaxID=482537 RepID=A0ABM0RKJ6_GALVR|nr:PREDICTED: matrix extracellular phosphoglycoprotein-like [Galeopterus variegatus]
MQVVCVGLLLFSVTWAAPEEKNKDNIALHFDKRSQESSKENIVQEREEDLPLFEVNENNQSSKSPNFFANRQTLNKGYSINDRKNAYDDLKMSLYTESTENKRVEGRDDAISRLHDQEEYGAALIRNNMLHVMRPAAVVKVSGEENKKNKPRHVLSKVPAGVKFDKAHSKDKKTHQRDPQVRNTPVKNKSTHQIQHNADYRKQLLKVKKIPSDFEGSGYTDIQERKDNDISPFSGDGQPFKVIPGKEGAIGSDPEGTDIQTGFSGPSEAETINPDTRGPGYNEIPEREESGGNTIGTREETVKEADAVDVSLVEGGNDITGSTNFKELPGKEGNRVDAGSQNAHQGKVEFHYPPAPSKEKRKEGSRDATESTNYNEIPKNGKGGARKGTQHSDRNQVTLNEKQRFSSKGKSQGLVIPSHDLDNEIKNEVGSHNGPNNNRNIITHSRENHYVPHRQNNSVRNKGMPRRKGPWGYRKTHSNRSFGPSEKDDSSDSSDSGSSSESDGD